MSKLTSKLVVLFAIINFQIVFSQTNLFFNLKEMVTLPSIVQDLSIIDYNGDGFLDYTYRDTSMAYVINGINRDTIANFPIPSGTLKIAFGDINQDGTADIAVAGRYPQSADTSFAIIYDGIYFNIIAGIKVSKPDTFADQYPSDIYLGRYFDRNIFILGLKVQINSYNPPVHQVAEVGRLMTYYYNNDSIILISDRSTDGYAKYITPYHYGAHSYLAIKQVRNYYEYGAPYGPQRCNRANLYSLDNTLLITYMWESGCSIDPEEAPCELLIGKPGLGQNDQIFVLCHDSLFCLGEWSISSHNFDYYITLAKIGESTERSLLYFSNSSFNHWLYKIYDPLNGQLNDSGQTSTHVRGFQVTKDQENDGIDEYYFLSQNTVYIYNLTMGSGIDDDKSILPNNYCSVSNYPNPFNSSTEIQFELSQPFQVNLKIYNIEGRETAILLDDYLNSGKYYIKWDAKNVPSGIYFVRLAANNNIATHKLILLK
jgi:hypothetical protein